MKLTIQSDFFSGTVFPYAQETTLIEVYWDREQEENERTKTLTCIVKADTKPLIKRLSKDLNQEETVIKQFTSDIKGMLKFDLSSMNTYHYYGTPTNERSKEWLQHKFELNDSSIVKYHVEALLYDKIKQVIKGKLEL